MAHVGVRRDAGCLAVSLWESVYIIFGGRDVAACVYSLVADMTIDLVGF